MNNVIEEMKDQAYGHLTKRFCLLGEFKGMMNGGFYGYIVMI